MIDQTEAVMDEKMRKAMEEAIEKFNGAFASKAGFQFGVEWCLEYLGKAAIEFDEKAAAKASWSFVNDHYQNAGIHGTQVARWQFAQLASKLNYQAHLTNQISLLEAKLSAAEAEIVRLDKNNALLETRLRRLPDGPRR